ncbi:histidine N-acetyltransferase-like [Mercenaria mercenaria]|uniref:histidine N-acetyltransferase-like n=1 Tax=Mercenaria mercenaria TaxID=6596 RepID=UPI00234E5640|nr:histidine N-acetyltransferase-like [Mercenaria mercenaria]
MEYCNNVRQATPDDKPAVLQMLDGLDYLFEYYDYFQNSENVTPYVYTENGKILAYVACCRVDNGETAVIRGGRVCPGHQGKNVFKRLLNVVDDIQKSDGVIQRYAQFRDHVQVPSESFLRTYKQIASKPLQKFRYKRSNISCELLLKTSDCISKVKVIDNIPFEFLSSPYSNYLFPEGRVIVEWVPFRFQETNIPLFKGRNTVFVSDVMLNKTDTVQETDKTAKHQENDSNLPQNASEVQGLLSASTIYKEQNEIDLSCVLDIFGNDIGSLRNHIIWHLQRIETTGLEDIIVTVITTKGVFEQPLLEKVLDTLGIDMKNGPIRGQFKEPTVYETESIQQ